MRCALRTQNAAWLCVWVLRDEAFSRLSSRAFVCVAQMDDDGKGSLDFRKVDRWIQRGTSSRDSSPIYGTTPAPSPNR